MPMVPVNSHHRAMERCQSGLLCFPAKEVDVTVPQVRSHEGQCDADGSRPNKILIILT